MSDKAGMMKSIAVCLGLLVMTVAVFWPVAGHEFVDYDDHAYVTSNPIVREGLTWAGLKRAATTFWACNWHPLTWLSHMLDVELFGLAPGGHHLTSLLLHAAAGVLFFLVLFGMTGALWKSALTAALFLIHPLHVESVAWVSERKDVLSGFLWAGTMGTYLWYARRPGWVRYLALLAVYALGLMSKPMLVTLPLVLLLLDVWPLGRWPWALGAGSGRPPRPRGAGAAWLLLEKVPLLALAAASGVVTYLAQSRSGAVQAWERLSFGDRLATALTAYGAYILKMIWPSGLAFFYPRPRDGFPAWQVALSALLLLAVTLLVLKAARSRPYLSVGWLWYLGTLVPVSGLIVQVGSQAMADRYTYLPAVGLFMLAAWGLPEVFPGLPGKKAVPATAAAAVISCLMVVSFRQQWYWRDDQALFRHGVDVNPDNWPAHNSLGVNLAKRGRIEEAVGHFLKALEVEPEYPKAHFNMGLARARQGRIAEAMDHYWRSLSLDPGYAGAHLNLGVLLAGEGRWEEAIYHERLAVSLDPGFADGHYNLALSLEAVGRPADAERELRQAIILDPGLADAYGRLGLLLKREGRYEEAARYLGRMVGGDKRR